MFESLLIGYNPEAAKLLRNYFCPLFTLFGGRPALPEQDSLPQKYATLPGRTVPLSQEVGHLWFDKHRLVEPILSKGSIRKRRFQFARKTLEPLIFCPQICC